MSNKIYGIVYRTTNLVNGKMYIGQHKVLDDYCGEFDGYLGSGVAISRAITYYGAEKFIRETLEECYSKEELDKAEETWLAKYNCADSPVYYNLTNNAKRGGREKGYHHSEETRLRLREVAKLRGISESTRKKMNETKSKNSKVRGANISKAKQGTIVIHNEEHQLFIQRSDLQEYLDKGYQLGQHPSTVTSRANSQRGKPRAKASEDSIINRSTLMKEKRWVYKGDEVAFVSKGDLNYYIANGWSLGKPESFKELMRSQASGKVSVTKEGVTKHIHPSSLDAYLEDGWVRGQSSWINDKIRQAASGKVWVQNGVEALKIDLADLQSYLDKGYIRGQKIKPLNCNEE